MPESISLRFYLKNAFDFEVRNKLDTRIILLNEIDELSEEETDELEMLNLVRYYLIKRIGEMIT